MDSMEKGLSFRGAERDRDRERVFYSEGPPVWRRSGRSQYPQSLRRQIPFGYYYNFYSYRLRRVLNHWERSLERRFGRSNLWRVAVAAGVFVFILVFFSTTLFIYHLLFHHGRAEHNENENDNLNLNLNLDKAFDSQNAGAKGQVGVGVGVSVAGDGSTGAVRAKDEQQPQPQNGSDDGLEGKEEWLRLFEQPTAAFCAMESVPLVCAHGGDSTYTTPNTKKAFAAALRERVACVEMDVAAAKDGDLFVLHKRELLGILMQLEENNNNNNGSHKEEWWSGRPAKVEEFSAREIARMRTADGQKVLPAKDVLQVLLKDNHLKHIILDVKTHKIKEQGGGEGKGIEDENVREMVDGVKQLVRESPGCMEKCVVWAKSDAVIKAIGAELPGVRLGMTVMNETQESRDLGLDRLSRLEDAKAPPAWVAMHWEMVSEEIVARAHTLGKRVFGWTANTDDITSHILKHAADGIVTNYPSKVRKQISRSRELCAKGK